MRAQVEAQFEVKTVPSVEAVRLDYSNQFTILDEETTLEFIERIKDRVRQHAQTYGGQTMRIREIQIRITDP